MKDRLIVALDVDTIKQAKRLVDKLYPAVKIFKVGSQLFTSCGPEAVKMITRKGAKVFLDLKFHDIPNTVEHAVKAAKELNVFMVNVHASGGDKMMKAAAAAKGKAKTPILLAVTVLTSLDKEALKTVGFKKPPLAQVEHLALLAKACGINGVVCSANEAEIVRDVCGKNFTIVTPGIRPQESAIQDQKRIATPQYAFSHGANYIVVGRPITAAKDPLRAAKEIIRSM